MKDKKLKTKARATAPTPERIALLRERFEGDECRVQFVLWADGMHIDISGFCGKDDSPHFRPAICAWEGWRAAWVLKTPREA